MATFLRRPAGLKGGSRAHRRKVFLAEGVASVKVLRQNWCDGPERGEAIVAGGEGMGWGVGRDEVGEVCQGHIA